MLKRLSVADLLLHMLYIILREQNSALFCSIASSSSFTLLLFLFPPAKPVIFAVLSYHLYGSIYTMCEMSAMYEDGGDRALTCLQIVSAQRGRWRADRAIRKACMLAFT